VSYRKCDIVPADCIVSASVTFDCMNLSVNAWLQQLLPDVMAIAPR
jgi:hypothetical protein